MPVSEWTRHSYKRRLSTCIFPSWFISAIALVVWCLYSRKQMLAKRLSDKMTIDFHVAEDPLHSVAKGTGIALQNINNFSFLMNGN